MSLAVAAGLPLAGVLMLILGASAYGALYSGRAAKRWPSMGHMVDTEAGPLHVVETGVGPAVVLVHGASSNNRELRSALERPLVEAGFRVIAIDRQGFGGSPGAPRKPGRLRSHARAVGALIDALGLERPIVVGHSYGAAVGLRLAIDRPGLSGGYVLLGPATHGDVGPVAWFNYVGAAPGFGWLFAYAVTPIFGPLLARGGLGTSFAPRPAPDGHLEATAVGLLFRPASFAANSADLGRVNPELREQQARYNEIRDPVVLIAGEADRTVPTSRHAERAAAAIRGARLAVLPGVGHMPHHAAPGFIVEHVRALQVSVEAEARPARERAMSG
jgi:pimeloyl-ACP methyl ester carboxylesterase